MDVRKWIEKNTIFHGVLGSRAYGIHTETSDYDYRGVAIAPKDYYIGLNVFEQLITKDPDSTIFDVKKFFKLAMDCNPNIIEFMFLHEENILKSTPLWEKILENRNIFLSKRAKHRYVGYAYSQLKRVKSHKHWLLNPIETKPTRAEFGLPDSDFLNRELIGNIEFVIKECISEHLHIILAECADSLTDTMLRNYIEFDFRHELDEAFADFVYPTVFNKLQNNRDVMCAIGGTNFSEEIIDIYNQEKKYSIAMSQWKQYEDWKRSRNPDRAELEAKFGYDTKHIGHVFRLLIQAEEILNNQTLHVRLNDENREFVLSIKSGKYKYDEIIEMSEKRILEFEKLYETSTLQHSPDFNMINSLLTDVVEEFYRVA